MQANLLDANNEQTFTIRQSDFRRTSGIKFPHRIEYFDGTGRTIAIETVDELEVDVAPFELEQETVAH